nr:hypothetical protein [Streptomyces pini]
MLAGLDVRGRASRLRVNYRSTEEIPCWSASRRARGAPAISWSGERSRLLDPVAG